MDLKGSLDTIYANFFFVDIVGLSDPEMATENQVRKIELLNSFIESCPAFKSSAPNRSLILPTGDGMAIGFLEGREELPLQLAIELHKKINAYNKGRLPHETIEVRIGIHGGSVYKFTDIRHEKNVWGPGIILARRIMDIGDDGHILLSKRIAEDLRELSDEYKRIIHPLELYTIKHNVRILVYTAYGSGFGRKKLPTKMKSRINEFLYSYIEVAITIKDARTMFVHYKRTYEIQNISDEPIETVTHQIGSDVEKTFEQLNVKVYDDDGKDLEISSVEVDKEYQKEFATSFHDPILKKQRRRYFLEYELEEPERYFENAFIQANCEKFVVTLDYPSNARIKPVIYEVNMAKGMQKKLKTQPTVTSISGSRKQAIWSKRNIHKGQSYRIVW
jgi:hypothetical protein